MCKATVLMHACTLVPQKAPIRPLIAQTEVYTVNILKYIKIQRSTVSSDGLDAPNILYVRPINKLISTQQSIA